VAVCTNPIGMLETIVYNLRCWAGGKVMRLGHLMLPHYVRIAVSWTTTHGLNWVKENEAGVQTAIDNLKALEKQDR